MLGIPYKIHPSWASDSPDVEGAINIRGKVKPMVTHEIGKYNIVVDVSIFHRPGDKPCFTYKVLVAGKVTMKFPRYIGQIGTAMVDAVTQLENQ